MHSDLLNVTAQLFLFWRSFSDQIDRHLPGSKPAPATFDNFSNYYYNYDDEYLNEAAADSMRKLFAAASPLEVQDVADEHFARSDWRVVGTAAAADLNKYFTNELAAIAKLARRTTRVVDDPISSYNVYRLSIWMERYLYPPMLFIGLFGNALTFIVLSRPIISAQGSSAVYLKMLCVHDTVNLFIGVTRKWMQNVWRYDIRESSTLMCKVHRFAHYTCLDASHWVLAAITIDRVIAVVFPFHAQRFCRRRIAFVVIALIWLFFGSLNSFVLFGVGLEPVTSSNIMRTTPVASLWLTLPTQRQTFQATTPPSIIPDRPGITIKAPNSLLKFGPPSNQTTTMATSTLMTPPPNVRYQCKFIDKDAEYFAINFHRWLIAAFYIVGPFGIVLFGNILITKKLFERKSFLDQIHRGISRIRRGSGVENQATLRTTTTMLFISSVAFLVLGTPTFILLVSGPYFEPQLNRSNEGKAYLFFIRAVESFMTYLNHSSHFFFYTMLGRQFRKEFKQINVGIFVFFVRRLMPKRYWPTFLKKQDDPDFVSMPTVASICVKPDSSLWRQVDFDDIKLYTSPPKMLDDLPHIEIEFPPRGSETHDANVHQEENDETLKPSMPKRELTVDSGLASLGPMSASSSSQSNFMPSDRSRSIAITNILRIAQNYRRATFDHSNDDFEPYDSKNDSSKRVTAVIHPLHNSDKFTGRKSLTLQGIAEVMANRDDDGGVEVGEASGRLSDNDEYKSPSSLSRLRLHHNNSQNSHPERHIRFASQISVNQSRSSFSPRS